MESGRDAANVVLAVVVFGAAFSSLAFSSVAAAAPARLSNGRVTAEFGERGMTAIAGRTTGRWTLEGDDFRIAISGRTFQSERLPPPSRRIESNRVTFRFSAPDERYQFDVVYELEPEWAFISKQLVVSATPSRSFTVDEIAVFRTTIGEPVRELFVPKSARPALQTRDYGACIRFEGGRGLLAVVQNPFLDVERSGSRVTISYRPEMEWAAERGTFASDRGLLSPYRSTGHVLPAAMLPEWQMDGPASPPGMDESEIDAFTDLVRTFLLEKRNGPLNLFVGWCVNDYQIDTATADGRAEYKRILDRAAELGAEYVLYAPTNSALARREDSADDWGWENLLWLGLGQKIRRNEWDPRTDPVPPGVQEMLDHARSKHLKLVAYVYPVLPFSQNATWPVPSPNDPNRRNASLGVPAFQDWLVELLVAFQKRTGIGGYAFDHTFLTYRGTSRYAQWWGWRHVMEDLRRRLPDIAIDGRQAYHLYGPWSWLAGSYPHPTFNDEQPESFVPFPDLHFDRVSADRERFTAYRYRNYEFAPSEIVPGFITHQTPRLDDSGDMPQTKTPAGIRLDRFRARDWDYLGWKYSLLSSIAIAGLNNVLNMIPARDADEYRAFSDTDIRWFRGWLDWTRANRLYLAHTRTILGQPAIGHIDGTSAIVGDRGYVFLFNPNGRALEAEFVLDETIGLAAHGRFLLKELYPLESRLVGKPEAGFWTSGDRVTLRMDGGSALVLQLEPAPEPLGEPVLFNSPGQARIDGTRLEVIGVTGEVGTEATVLVAMPAGRTVSAVRINGRDMGQGFRVGSSGEQGLAGSSAVVSVRVHFDGERFAHYEQVGAYDPAFSGGTVSSSLRIPRRVFDQLSARAKAWPIPWSAEDYRTSWLASDRLLLYVQIAEPDDRMDVRLKIDGRAVALNRAYSAIHSERRTFTGFYADVSLLDPDREYSVELTLPPLKAGQFQGLFFENVETEYTARLR